MTAIVCNGLPPEGAHGPCCYGPNVRAATALLACNGHMSITRAADLMGVLLDAPVSTGFTGGLVARIAKRLPGFETALKTRLRAAPVMHHDQTPTRVAADDADRLLYIYTARAGKLLWFGAADKPRPRRRGLLQDPARLPRDPGPRRLHRLRQVRQGPGRRAAQRTQEADPGGGHTEVGVGHGA